MFNYDLKKKTLQPVNDFNVLLLHTLLGKNGSRGSSWGLVDAADNAQVEAPWSVEEGASQPDPWLGDGHRK